MLIEIATDRFGSEILASEVREATPEEIERLSAGCNHPQDESLIKDIPGHLYDLRTCAVCKTLLGLV